MGMLVALPEVLELVRWLNATIPFFTVLPAFVGIVVLFRFFLSEIRLGRPTPTHPDGEYRFDPDDFD
ncbi:hypothetical protein [Haladaptatus salinisoli]|uniref:hypothetical protein n=1 Tax=Haladaptatus salinisoli TaxID=2884876 RepID=UPI001D0B2C3D|nr:hypothetical protein [Haladaptatus salinisoli]